MDTPTRLITLEKWSNGEFRYTADNTPNGIPTKMAIISANDASSMVAGKKWRISSSTGRPV